jgi:hypothetical protein
MARPVPRAALAVAVLSGLLVAGCGGGSSSSTAPSRSAKPSGPAGSRVVACKGTGAAAALRATAVDCASARAVMRGWGHVGACALATGESRGACSVSGFRCQSVRTGKGVSVSCARPGEAIAFIPRTGG